MDTDTNDRIQAQVEGGKKLGNILQELLDFTHVGTSLLDIEKLAQTLIKEAGGTPSFETVEGYKWATCLCVNEEVVHGIPKNYSLKDGDIVTIDVGMLYHGYHTDTAWTKIVKSSPPAKVTGDKEKSKEEFLRIGEQALWEAIGKAKAGNRIGDISQAIQKRIEGAGYSIITSLVGHTVGRQLHEKPQVPGYLRGPIEATPILTVGMALAIEIIYAMGKGEITYANTDGWTLATKDGSLSGVFEHTIRITGGEAEVLTKLPK